MSFRPALRSGSDKFRKQSWEVQRVHSVSNLKQFYGRIVVISNRLPINIEDNKDGGEDRWNFKMSSGGLVAGLEGVKKKLPFLWLGWTGRYFEGIEDQKALAKVLMEKFNCVPVYIKDQLADDYYNGFSNGVLWPLFHYLASEACDNYNDKIWNAYVECNNKFADAVLDMWQPGDLIWIHDYHLLMLPEILRKQQPKIRLGFFLHIPFPSSEVFAVFIKRKAILTGMLNCDMIGFHTYDYARHFMSSCTKILGIETTPGGIHYEGRFIPIRVMPIGIDPEKFHLQLKEEPTIQKIQEYKSSFAGMKIILGVDRLDYIKGMPHRLRGLERFFVKYPEWQGKVVLIQVAVPSRTDVEKYKALKQQVEHLVGHINGTYGSIGYHPVHYFFKSIAFPELTAMYAVSDVALITSLRDGMNLVAEEYIACQQEGHGVLILSEFAGSSGALGSGALIVNPYDAEEVADAIFEAVTMEPTVKEAKHKKLHDWIDKHTASSWGELFLKELDQVNRTAEKLDKIPKLSWHLINHKFTAAKKRLLVFATDGGLIPYHEVPFLATPSRRVMVLLQELCENPRNIVYVVSSRDRRTLQSWFGHLNAGLIAEHGFYTRLPQEHGSQVKNQDLPWESLENSVDLSFKAAIKPIFQYFTDRTPGSFFEERDSSLTWHFRATSRNFGKFRAQELHTHLGTVAFHANTVVSEKSLEVRPHECNPTTVLKRIMKNHPEFDFLLYVGEATANTDELEALPHVMTCSVAKKNQKYYVEDAEDVVALMRALATNGVQISSPKLPHFMRGRPISTSPVFSIKNLTLHDDDQHDGLHIE